MTTKIITNEDHDILTTATAILEAEGAEREVSILVNSECEVSENDEYGILSYVLIVGVPIDGYKKIKKELNQIKQRIHYAVSTIAEYYGYKHAVVIITFISPKTIKLENTYMQNSENVNNQGKVRSDNPARIECDGLYFRSYPEINLYKAIKRLGVLVAPLPVFLHGGKTFKRTEPDFVLLKHGMAFVVEVDGDATHAETEIEDNGKDLMFEREGIRVIRVRAQECFTEEGAKQVVLGILRQINEYSMSQCR